MTEQIVLPEGAGLEMVGETAGKNKLIGQALLEAGLLNQAQLDQLLVNHAKQKQRLGESAVQSGFLEESELAKFLARFFRLDYRGLETDELDLAVVEAVPETLARRYCLIAVERQDSFLTLAMADPLDVRAVDAVRLETGCRVRKVVASRSSVLRAIDRSYHAASRLAKSMDHLLSSETTLTGACQFQHGDEASVANEELQHEASDAPVVQFVSLLLMRAIQERASDIHIEPEERSVNVRLRVDGQLREVSAPPKQMLRAVTTRIKLLGNLDIAEHRLPQDGRFKFKVFDKTIDVRLSCLPTVYGEKLVLRILDRASLILDMKELGFEPKMLEAFRKTLTLPNGLIILTGPTGSGKTTTLYAALNSIRTPTKNIVTIEDPVEYQLPKVNQVHTRPSIGLSFAAGLRSILRQDPDIIMVGEIRDRETAEICIRSALTGHLVLSTLHTNDAISAISRLKDMGIEPYLLTASLSLVMAQRLVRRVCEECAASWEPPQDLMVRLKKAVNGQYENNHWKFRRGKGCRKCSQSGYFGRIAIYEQFVISDQVKSLVAEGSAMHQIKETAQKEGHQSLLLSALNKVHEGTTTLDEAFSICAAQSDTLT